MLKFLPMFEDRGGYSFGGLTKEVIELKIVSRFKT